MAESMTSPPRTRNVPPLIAGLASLLVPGLGQTLSGRLRRGLYLLLIVAGLLILNNWSGTRPDCIAGRTRGCLEESTRLILLVPVALVWLWGAWDAAQVARGSESRRVLLVLAVAIAIFGMGWQITQMDFGLLLNPVTQTGGILSALVNPDYLTRETEDKIFRVAFESPCSDNPPSGITDRDGITLHLSQVCGEEGDRFTLTATGFFPELETELLWVNPIGQTQRLVRDGQALILTTDADGAFTTEVYIPVGSAPPSETQGRPQLHRGVEVRQFRPIGGLELSVNGQLILKGMGETLSMALLATVLATIGAVPLSFVAARNLMRGNRVTRAIYNVVRTFLNILRSIESLILAIVLINWTGLGPLTGVLALSFHGVAALGKLYSESVENIDPGPIEAIRATGAGWVQMVRYAVLPQVIPPFLGYTIYRWDINVRLAVVIGLVGGGGIGANLLQWINQNQFRAIGGAFWAIVLVVSILDYFSARTRERWG